MPVDEIQAIYKAMQDSDDLATLFPEMSGNWSKDKKKFSAQYLSNEQALEDLGFEEDFEFF